MIDIILGNSFDDKKKINKSFTKRITLPGVVKEPSSIIDPTILIQANLSQLSGFNYCEIPEFRRCYYITNIKTATNDTCSLSLHVDVLMSFRDQLMSCGGYVDRQENVVSVMITDPERLRQINPAISTIPFNTPAESGGYTYCLMTTKAV